MDEKKIVALQYLTYVVYGTGQFVFYKEGAVFITNFHNVSHVVGRSPSAAEAFEQTSRGVRKNALVKLRTKLAEAHQIVRAFEELHGPLTREGLQDGMSFDIPSWTRFPEDLPQS